MSSVPLSLCIRRSVYNWLIKTSGWTNDEIGKQLFSERIYREVFKTNLSKRKADVTIPFEKAMLLAEILKRPLSVLFLSKPPKEPPLPKDYRVLKTEPPEYVAQKKLCLGRKKISERKTQGEG